MADNPKEPIVEMKAAAEKARAATDAEAMSERDYVAATVDFTRKCNPAAVLALIAEIERQAAENKKLVQRQQDDAATFERMATSIGMSWCCTAETMELESRIRQLAGLAQHGKKGGGGGWAGTVKSCTRHHFIARC